MDKKGDNSFGIASVVLGILSVVLSPAIIFSTVLGVIGLIFGIAQRKREKNKWSLWGIILSIVGILISLFLLFAFISLITGFQETIASCAQDPNLPGCQEILKMYSGSSSAYSP